MRYRDPIIQTGLTREEAEDIRDRYLRLHPRAKVSITSQPDNPQLKTLITLLPWQPLSSFREPGFVCYRGWRI